VELVKGFAFVQADRLSLLQCLDGFLDHGYGLPKVADQLSLFRESLRELVLM
jgi:hypothetical protein